jgi:hypothetical protein
MIRQYGAKKVVPPAEGWSAAVSNNRAGRLKHLQVVDDLRPGERPKPTEDLTESAGPFLRMENSKDLATHRMIESILQPGLQRRDKLLPQSPIRTYPCFAQHLLLR